MTTQAGTRGGMVLPLWALGFRPFFLAAAAWAALALLLWIIALQSGASLPSRFDPLSWHIHEMLFGFVPAAIAGFLLTAIPTWTGRPPIRGHFLAGLAGIWLLGRFAVLLSGKLPIWISEIIDVSFLFFLSAVAACEIAISRNRRNIAIPLPVLVLGVANLLMHLEAAGVAVPAGLGWRLGLAAITVLISVIGGRIIPAFTRNWLGSRNSQALPAPHGLVDSVGMGLLHGGLIGWALVPDSEPIGILLILAAIVNFLRLLRWKGARTLAEPLLAILHIGFLWLVSSAALLGASMLTDNIPLSAAIHAMTAGTIGTTVLAVMTRVSLGHTGRALHADQATSLIYILVTAAGVARVFAPFEPAHYTALLEISAALWIGAFAAFGIRYAPLLFSSRIK
ncbi:MAG: NnrS family protein [Alphaproteobacteria bacterium]|nr:NnrS family protein [Alphaproteobacteria bacterium]